MSFITTALTFVWNHSAAHVSYLIHFEDNQESLSTKASELQARKDDVKRRISHEEAKHLTSTALVDDWLRSVEETLVEVHEILEKSSEQIKLQCIADCCLQNWCTCYNLGKQVNKKLATVDRLISQSKFHVVADKFVPSRLQIISESPTVGMDELFDKVWNLLQQDGVNIMGIWGMGGVGKTTLLEKINNAFLRVEGKKFDVVIWVVVANDFTLQSVQKKVAERLGFEWVENEDSHTVTQRIFNELSNRKFVLLFDDLWQPLNLKSIGIPVPRQHHSKVVFTTRSKEVCRYMDTDKTFKVSVLGWNQAWELFQEKLLPESVLDSYPELFGPAMEVAKECKGLPLALITVARALSTKTTSLPWKNALKTLKGYASEFSGMAEKVLGPLKFSYDSLENDSVRNCLLYCSLYPEDYNFDRDLVVEHWIGEGFLEVSLHNDISNARGQGHTIIASLEDACLLESSKISRNLVKMHDVVRGMALWIARETGKKKNKVLVQAGHRLTEAPTRESWKDAEWVSLMENWITELPNPPESPRLMTLLLQSNRPLSGISPEFFKYMPNLRVLNLSDSKIREIPKSIGDLAELQFLDVSSTCIESVPDELANLTKLRMLNLCRTLHLRHIPRGVISQLVRLQSLNLFRSGYDVHPSDVEEFERLEALSHLGITIRDFAAVLSRLAYSHRLRSCLKRLCVRKDNSITEFQLAPSLLHGLTEIEFGECLEREELKINCGEAHQNNMELLEELVLYSLPKLNTVWIAGTASHQQFKMLSTVYISNCHALKEVSWLVLVPLLNVLYIDDCKEIEDILVDEGLARPSVEDQSTFSRLEKMTLSKLPKLQSISGAALLFPSLTDVEIVRCPLLKKLPFTFNSTNKSSLQIKGEPKWWDGLEWEDETAKTSFQSYFFPESVNLSNLSDSELEGSEIDVQEFVDILKSSGVDVTGSSSVEMQQPNESMARHIKELEDLARRNAEERELLVKAQAEVNNRNLELVIQNTNLQESNEIMASHIEDLVRNAEERLELVIQNTNLQQSNEIMASHIEDLVRNADQERLELVIKNTNLQQSNEIMASHIKELEDLARRHGEERELLIKGRTDVNSHNLELVTRNTNLQNSVDRSRAMLEQTEAELLKSREDLCVALADRDEINSMIRDGVLVRTSV